MSSFLLFDLPRELVTHILIEWIDITSLSHLDNSCTNRAIRERFLDSIRGQAIRNLNGLPSFNIIGLPRVPYYHLNKTFESNPSNFEYRSPFLLLDWFNLRNLSYKSFPVGFALSGDLPTILQKKAQHCLYPHLTSAYFVFIRDISVSELEAIFSLFPSLSRLYMFVCLLPPVLHPFLDAFVAIRPSLTRLESFSIHFPTTLAIDLLENCPSFLPFLEQYKECIHFVKGIVHPTLQAAALLRCPKIHRIDVGFDDALDHVTTCTMVNEIKLQVSAFNVGKIQYFPHLKVFQSDHLIANDQTSALFLSILQHCKDIKLVDIKKAFVWRKALTKDSSTANSLLQTNAVTYNKTYNSELSLRSRLKFAIDESLHLFSNALSIVPPIRKLGIKVSAAAIHDLLPTLLAATVGHALHSQHIEQLTLDSMISLSLVLDYNLPNLQRLDCSTLPARWTSMAALLSVLKKYSHISLVRVPGIVWQKVSFERAVLRTLKVKAEEFCSIDRTDNDVKVTMKSLDETFCNLSLLEITELVSQETSAMTSTTLDYSIIKINDNLILNDNEEDDASHFFQVLNMTPVLRSIKVSLSCIMARKLIMNVIKSSPHNESLRKQYRQAAKVIADAARNSSSQDVNDLKIVLTIEDLLNFIQPNADLFPPITAIQILDGDANSQFATLIDMKSFSSLQRFVCESCSVSTDLYLFRMALKQCPLMNLIVLDSLVWMGKKGRMDEVPPITMSIVADLKEEYFPVLHLIKRQFYFEKKEIVQRFQIALEMSSMLHALCVAPGEYEANCLNSILAALHLTRHIKQIKMIKLPGDLFLDVFAPQSSLLHNLSCLELEQCNEKFWKRWRTLQKKPTSPLKGLRKMSSISFSDVSDMNANDFALLLRDFPHLTVVTVTGRNVDRDAFMSVLRTVSTNGSVLDLTMK